MHRIDSAGAIDGKFSEGNPQIGQRATVVSAAWLNDIQENLIELLTFAGIAPQKADPTQVRAAVMELIEGVVGTGDGSVPTTRRVLTAGLATGGGQLIADITVTVPKATAADVAIGESNDKAVTPAAMATVLASRVPSNRQVVGGGLVTGGGALDADRTLTVQKASSVEVFAGDDDSKAITPLGLRAALGSKISATRRVIGGGLVTGGGALDTDRVLSVTGATYSDILEGYSDARAVTPLGLDGIQGQNRASKYSFLVGGVLLQWGTAQGFYSGDQLVGITLPTSFLDEEYALVLTPINLNGSSVRDTLTQRVTKSTGYFSVYLQFPGGTGDRTIEGFEWFAIGRWK
jgi:hypothetical protein